jgi:hypothetical protein
MLPFRSRAGDAGRLEQLLVVVEAVVVGEQRQRAPLALVLRVVARRPREQRRVDLRLLHQRCEVDPPAAAAVVADVVRVERADDIGRRARANGGDDLVVVDAADHVDRDLRMRLVIFGSQLLEAGQLVPGAPAHPDSQLRRRGAVYTTRERARSDRERSDDERDCRCATSHLRPSRESNQ